MARYGRTISTGSYEVVRVDMEESYDPRLEKWEDKMNDLRNRVEAWIAENFKGSA